MCGRFTLRTPMRDVARLFDLPADAFAAYADVPPRYNVAPTQEIAAVRTHGHSAARELAWLRWGLIPPWADDPAVGNRMINARSETLATKPAFREAFRTRRCLVPTDGFYEWKRQGAHRAKQPCHIRLRDEQPFAFAGLWERWKRGDLTIESCTIITTEPNELLAELYHRMPVILSPEQFAHWLDPAVEDPRQLEPLLATYPAEGMIVTPVSMAVNNARHDAPDCVAAPAAGKTQGTLFD